MYPYKINWATESLKEIHEDNSYGYADDLMEIKQIIYKYIDEYIYECENKIKIEIKNYGTITLNKFYEMVNSEPYFDFIFLSVKYFDCSLKTWVDYHVNENELNNLKNTDDKLKKVKEEWEIQQAHYENLIFLFEQDDETTTNLEIINNHLKMIKIEKQIADKTNELKTPNIILLQKQSLNKQIKALTTDLQAISTTLKGGKQRGSTQRGGSNLDNLPPQLHNYFEQYKTLEETVINIYSIDLKSVFNQDLDETKLMPASPNSFFDSILNSINNYNTNNPLNTFSLSKGTGPQYTIDNLYNTLVDLFKDNDNKTGNENIYNKFYAKFINEFDKYQRTNYSDVQNYVSSKLNDPIYKALSDENLPMKLNTSFQWDQINTANNDIFVQNSAKFYKVLKTGDYSVDKYSQNPLIKIIQDSLNLYISIIAMDRNKSCHLPTRQDNKYYYMFLYLLNNNYTIFSNNHLSKIHTLYKVLPKSIYTFTEFNSQIQTGEIPSLLLILYLYVHCDNTSIYPFSLLKSEIDKLDYTQKQLIKKEAEKLKNYKPSAASASAYSQQNYGQSASINRTNFCYYVTLRLDLYEGYELPLMNCDMKQQNILTEFTDLTGYTIPSEIKILGQHIPTGVPGPIDENKWLDMLNTNKPDKNKPATPTMFNQVTNLFKQAGQLINPNAAATATAALATTNALTAARPAAARPAPARPKLKGGINTRKKHSPTTKKIIFTKFKMPHATRRHHNITHKHMN